MRLIKKCRFYLGLLCVSILGGCQGGCKDNYVSENSLQGKELAAILHQQRKIEVIVPAELPVTFKPVEVEKKTDSAGSRYRAVLVWQLAGLRDAVRPQPENLIAVK